MLGLANVVENTILKWLLVLIHRQGELYLALLSNIVERAWHLSELERRLLLLCQDTLTWKQFPWKAIGGG
jgi:hypothetical protein